MNSLHYDKVNTDDVNETVAFKWRRELRIWIKLSFYSSTRMFVELAPWMISLSLIGHKSVVLLSALSVVEIWVYTWIVIVWDFTSQTECVLISQALGSITIGKGKKAKSLMSIRSWLSLSMFIMLLCNVVVILLCFSTHSVLLLFGFDENIAYEGSVYAINIIPAVIFEGFNVCLTGFLTSIQLGWPCTIIGICALIGDFVVEYSLIYGKGAYPSLDPLKAVALGWFLMSLISFILNIIIIKRIWGQELVYSLHGKEEEEASSVSSSPMQILESSGINDECLLSNNNNNKNNNNKDNNNNNNNNNNNINDNNNDNDNNNNNDNDNNNNNNDDELNDHNTNSFSISTLKQIFFESITKRRVGVFARLALPNLTSSCVQNLSYLFVSLLAAKLGTVQVSVHNTNIALLEVVFTVIRGMAEATTVRIGYHIGADNILDAKKVLLLSILVNFVFGLIASLSGYTFRYQIATLFTNDSNVIERSANLSSLLWSSYFIYTISSSFLATLEAQGKSTEYAIIQTIGQWLVTLPISLVSFFFTTWDLEGIWLSMLLGYTVTSILTILLIYIDTDWKKIVNDSKKRQYEEVSLSLDEN